MNEPVPSDAHLKLRGLQHEGFSITSCELKKGGRSCRLSSDGSIRWKDVENDGDIMGPFGKSSPLTLYGFAFATFLAASLFFMFFWSSMEKYEMAHIARDVKRTSSLLAAKKSQIEKEVEAEISRAMNLLVDGLGSCKKTIANDVRAFVEKKQKPVKGKPGEFFIGPKTAETAEGMLDNGLSLCQQVFFEQTKLLEQQAKKEMK